MTNIPHPSLWNDEDAKSLDERGLLLYRSHLLGGDLSTPNLRGGSTSAKLMMREPLTGVDVKVLMTSNTGGELGVMSLDSFAMVYLDKLAVLQSRYKNIGQEDSMALDLSHCVFNLSACAPSVEIFMSGFIPHAHVDHMHCDAVNSIAATKNSAALVKEIFGEEIAYLPWQRPGIDLGLKIGRLASDNAKLVGVIIGHQGLLTWGETSKNCYETTLRIANKALGWLNDNSKKPPFGGDAQKPLGLETRRSIAQRLMPEIRGLISTHDMKLGHFTDVPEVLEFVNSKELSRFAPLSAYCPDHSLGTNI
jgi:rhamnose utilization protein RhaD (predicted bifunctional aldolase and dehydrogenase)